MRFWNPCRQISLRTRFALGLGSVLLPFLVAAMPVNDYLIHGDADERRQFADHDGLTGLYNQRTFWTLLADELVRVQRFPRPVSLLMLDIDRQYRRRIRPAAYRQRRSPGVGGGCGAVCGQTVWQKPRRLPRAGNGSAGQRGRTMRGVRGRPGKRRTGWCA